MTALADTNAVLAYLLSGRPAERATVAVWVDQHGPLLVTEGVFTEVCWALGTGAAPNRAILVEHVRRLLASSSFDLWDKRLVCTTLRLLERHPKLAVVDCLLAARGAGGDAVVTFDRGLAAAIEQL
ncbi:MAG TPA: PIN domain-containing protein [Coriobacteriia bacterium]|nr:PIN domain-containing protein [Coriobacteriia bacterium]